MKGKVSRVVDDAAARPPVTARFSIQFDATPRWSLPSGSSLFSLSYARHLPHLLVVLADARFLASLCSLFALRVR
ncbi:hypothetical protein [Nocardia sp. NPDC050793]|uniref:hypothetical protein n=1 Tax=Nocardia sp. NPDC050793 TaxID=3155159 RepID=UPI0033DFD392